MLSSLYSPRYYDDGTITFSRDKQDRYAIDNIFKCKKNGFFLDIGASDGVNENNTLLFERYYDWDGICCECDSRVLVNLRNERTCKIINSPMFHTTGQIVNFELHQMNVLSSISGYQVPKYHSPTSAIVNMTTISLNDCLKYFGAPHVIDYMSLDTEGSEYDILSTFDFGNYKINYIAVEHNFQEPKRTNIKSLLESMGYCYHRSIVCDDDYILKEYAIEHNIKKND